MRVTRRLMVAILLTICFSIGASQELRQVPPRPAHLLFLPKKVWALHRKWPMILYLHGKSLRGSDLNSLKKYGLPKRLQKDKGFPFIVIAPQLANGQRWTDTNTLASLVNDVANKYPVDRSRIYAMGFSMGASGVWRVAHDHPSLFAAAVSIGGMYEKPLAMSGRLKGMPIWVIHGDADKDASPAGAREIFALHVKSGGTGQLTMLPGKGHNIPDVFDRSDL
ncbi:MAG: hypothetical protein QOJ65_2800, partial [Fimbriimonadaceae bacterium]|nr:hypothetical protein [Fimbriimonadaceae bacterium]